MPKSSVNLALLAVLLSSLGAARAAGTAEVSFPNFDHYADAGFTASDRNQTRETLVMAFDRLARRLPDGQTLDVRFSDIDLAGRLVWHRVTPLRVVDSPVDMPQLRFHYTLRSGDQVLRSGDANLRDMGFMNSLAGIGPSRPLGYEEHMLHRWFVDEFRPAVASAR